MFDRIMIIQHKGGEYISINISNLTKEKCVIWETLNRAETKLRHPSTTSNVALQILNTKFDKTEITEIASWIYKNISNIQRLAIVGANYFNNKKFKKSLKNKNKFLNFKIIYDWDTAKDWLIGIKCNS